VILTELLEPSPDHTWTIVKQAGVTHSVALMAGAEQQSRFLSAIAGGSTVPFPLLPPGERPWDKAGILALQELHASQGLTLTAIEDTAPMDKARLGLPGRDEEISHVIDQIRAMGACGIPVLCYNWMALTSWARTTTEVELRGGALATGYDDAVNRSAPPVVEPGSITAEQLWDGLDYFLRAVVPVAEESGVRLGVHPDDPPLPVVRGVPRIISSIDAYRRVVDIVPSRSNGITLCQGNTTLMTDDLPSVIRELGGRDKIAFVHFRDIRGTAENFIEVFHDEGQTDMVACMRAYRDVGFSGPLRPDHVPTLAGEDNSRPGYAAHGRLFAVGYIEGMRQAVYSERTA
jgi:mannonate dehydratase